MNNKEFTVHINFVKNKEFLKKKRISGLYLDFLYAGDYYRIYDKSNLILATLYTSNVSLMESLKVSAGYTSRFFSRYRIMYDSLLISKSKIFEGSVDIYTIDDIDRSSIYPDVITKRML